MRCSETYTPTKSLYRGQVLAKEEYEHLAPVSTILLGARDTRLVVLHETVNVGCAMLMYTIVRVFDLESETEVMTILIVCKQ